MRFTETFILSIRKWGLLVPRFGFNGQIPWRFMNDFTEPEAYPPLWGMPFLFDPELRMPQLVGSLSFDDNRNGFSPLVPVACRMVTQPLCTDNGRPHGEHHVPQVRPRHREAKAHLLLRRCPAARCHNGRHLSLPCFLLYKRHACIF